MIYFFYIHSGRGKKDETQAKEQEKNATVSQCDPGKLVVVQTPAKKSSRGGSSSSTERYVVQNI